jgi:riboflavin transporter FmnP
VYQRNTSFRGAIIGMAIGAVVCLATVIIANIIVTPLYMGAPRETVIGMIVPVLLPFNVLKIALNCVITAFVYKPISKALES